MALYFVIPLAVSVVNLTFAMLAVSNPALRVRRGIVARREKVWILETPAGCSAGGGCEQLVAYRLRYSFSSVAQQLAWPGAVPGGSGGSRHEKVAWNHGVQNAATR